MKTLFNTALPALALLALGGCATTGAVTSTEDDGVYYSSKDRTTVAQAPATQYQRGGYQNNGYGSATTTTQVPAGENANPDYQGGTTQAGTASGTDYYDDNYSYNSVQPSGFGQPYTGPGVSSYNYTPNWSVSPSFYGSPYGYGSALSIGYGFGGYSSFYPFYSYGYPAYGFYDPFYSPFYSPWGYGYGSRFSIGFGYGWGGFGGWGSPYYGGWGYPGYAYGGGYYGGGYYGDYGYGYGGARRYVYKQDIVNGRYPNGYGSDGTIMVGRRESRAVNAVGSGNVLAPGNAAVGSSMPSGRRAANGGTAAGGFGGAVAPAGPPASGYAGSNPAATNAEPGRRFEQATMNPNSPAARDINAGRGGWGRVDNGGNGGYNQPRMADTNPAGAAPQEGRRGGFFRQMFTAPANPGGNASNQGGFSQPQRAYSQPADRSFAQPRMEQRSFQPQPSQPAPSFGGSRGGFGGGGGGSFGGGGGGGGGRRGR